MKRFVFLFSALFLFHLNLIAASQALPLSSPTENKIELWQSTENGLVLNVRIGELQASTSKTPWGTFTSLYLPGMEGRRTDIGRAALPETHRLIDIPYGAEISVRVDEAEFEDIPLNLNGFPEPVMPYQGPIEKSEAGIRSHQFRMHNTYYLKNKFAKLPLAVVEEAGNIRGHRMGRLRLNTIQYNPAANILRVYTDLQITVQFSSSNASETRAIHKRYFSPVFEPLLREFLLNYQPSSRGDLTQYPIHILFIYYDSFIAALQPLIDWKQQMGYMVTATPISAIGNNTTAIKSYIQSLYNGPNPPSYVVLVGDKEQITTYNGQTGSHVSDLYYTTMTSPDFVPDIYIGRLSAQAAPQLTAQIDKILFHEKYRFTQTGFLDHGSFAATDDIGNYTTAEGTHNYVINTHFIPNNLQYDKLYAITYNATGQDVMNAVNAGRFILNYSGHGSTTSWGGPSVNQAMVNSLTNTGMYPFVISNACLTGSFELTECFGETWVRKASGGGLAFTGASNSTYWDEDDEWERRAYDGVFWENYYSLAAFIFRGNLAVLNAGYNSAQYYFEVYHLFGDPSTMLYWGVPQAFTVNCPQIIYIGSSIFDVTVAGEDSALVSLYMNGQTYGSALTDAAGHAQITLNPVPAQPGYMQLTVTKFNRHPFIDSLQVIPASGPYLYCLKPLVDDQATNGNGIPEAGELVTLNLQLANMGIQTATNIQATLSTTDSLVQILTAQTALGSLPAGDTLVGGGLLVDFDENLPHLSTCSFNLHLEADGGYTWDQTLTLQVRQGGKILLPASPAVFDPTFLNFTSSQVVTIQNTGPDTLWVTDMISDIPQFSASPTAFFVAPGGGSEVTILFTPDDTLTYQGTFTIFNSDPMHFQIPFSAIGSGIFAPDIAVQPDSVARTLNVTDSLTIPLLVKNEGLGELIFNAQIAGAPPAGLSPEGGGGSDNYGHIWIDSNEPGGPDFQWIDISQTGIPVSLSGNNAISDNISLPFDFPFYGQMQNQFRVCTNGWLSFNTYSVAYQNVALPSTMAPRALIAPLWDDLNFQSGSQLFYKTESNKIILQFQDVYRVTGEGPMTFQVILYDNGNILLQYLSLGAIVHDYTVGIQNQTADDGLTVAFNEVYLEDSLAVIISKHSWASVSPMAGTVAAQSSTTLLLTLKTHNFPIGQFTASVLLESNDPDEGLLYLPITMTVDSTTVGLEEPGNLRPLSFGLEQNWPNPFNPSTRIRYSVDRVGEVRLEIFNLLGQRVRTLVNQTQKPQEYEVVWDGTNDAGRDVASGVYVYRLQAGERMLVRKLMLMR